ncbi:hypothetical protein [Pseudobdellovibrio sp. HCB154]|uniref:hypothetical protein n=1 Tax=Pseudobdellovibrio sp. HCB154 TaxID=3386277 RepID=UPI003916F990
MAWITRSIISTFVLSAPLYIYAVTPLTVGTLGAGGVKSITPTSSVLKVTTSANAICKWSTKNQSYQLMPSKFKSTGSARLHEQPLTGLKPQTAYTYYVACQADNVTSVVTVMKFTTTKVPVAQAAPAEKAEAPPLAPIVAPVIAPITVPKISFAALPEQAYLASPLNNFTAGKTCVVYQIFDNSPAYNKVVTEIFSREATVNAAACKKFIEKHYLPFQGCAGNNVDGKSWSIVGVLKNPNSEEIKFDGSNGKDNLSLQQGSGAIVMAPAKCASSDLIGEQAAWEKVSSCDYAKTKFCVKADMPILYQASPKLAEHISAATGNSDIKRDMGWCGAVALTMSTLGNVYSSPAENMQDPFLWKNRLPALEKIREISDINERTSQYADLIYKIGQIASTNWARGGTQTDRAILKFFSRVDPSVGNLDKSAFEATTLRKTFQLLTDQFSIEAAAKNLTVGQNNTFARGQAIIMDCYPQKVEIAKSDGVRNYWKTSDFKCQWKKSGQTHALAVNGLEDDYLKIYDPWGKVYNLQVFEKTAVPHLNMQVAFAIPAGDSGYFRNNGMIEDLPADFSQTLVMAKSAPAPIGRYVKNFYYVALYGYQTAVIGKAKEP